MNEIAKHKTAIEDADTQNKVGTPLRFQHIIIFDIARIIWKVGFT